MESKDTAEVKPDTTEVKPDTTEVKPDSDQEMTDGKYHYIQFSYTIYRIEESPR